MMGLIERNYMLQFPFHDAEQHFLDWYFKFTRSACGPRSQPGYNDQAAPIADFTAPHMRTCMRLL